MLHSGQIVSDLKQTYILNNRKDEKFSLNGIFLFYLLRLDVSLQGGERDQEDEGQSELKMD